MPVNHFLPLVGNETVGQRTLHGTWLPPGSRVAAYVGPQSDSTDAYVSSSLLVSTLQAGLARCRSGKGDVVVVLPGHTENVSGADAWSNLVAGTRIISAGIRGQSSNPTFTWTATASTVLLDVADVVLSGLTLRFDGIDNVVAPLTISAQGCVVESCDIRLQNAAGSAGCVQGIAFAAGSSGSKVNYNKFLSDDNGEPQTGGGAIAIGTTATDGLNDIEVIGNYICSASPGDTVGQIDVITTCTNVRIIGNVLLQLAADANTGIRIDDVVSNGIVAHNLIKQVEAASVAVTGVIVAGTTNNTFGLFQNFVVDDLESVSGALSPVVMT